MLTFNTLLASLELEPELTLLVRQSPVEPALRRVLPWIALERPDLYLAYHQVQWPAAELALSKAERLISFIAHESGKAVLAAAYTVGPSSLLLRDNYWELPEHRELAGHGMAGPDEQRAEMKRFDLTPLPGFEELIGKLVLGWPPPAQRWTRWADRRALPISAIVEESLLARPMPPWEQMVLSTSDLTLLPKSWTAALSQWRGIYFVFDTARRAGYVGAAYGRENILGRWRNYAVAGNGGNKQLAASDPAHLRFSLLQRTSPDMASDEVQRLEATWKQRLHTRAHGLNAN